MAQSLEVRPVHEILNNVSPNVALICTIYISISIHVFPYFTWHFKLDFHLLSPIQSNTSLMNIKHFRENSKRDWRFYSCFYHIRLVLSLCVCNYFYLYLKNLCYQPHFCVNNDIFGVSGFLYVLAGITEMLMILTMTKSESFQNRNNMEKTVEVEEKLISRHVITDKLLNN